LKVEQRQGVKRNSKLDQLQIRQPILHGLGTDAVTLCEFLNRSFDFSTLQVFPVTFQQRCGHQQLGCKEICLSFLKIAALAGETASQHYLRPTVYAKWIVTAYMQMEMAQLVGQRESSAMEMVILVRTNCRTFSLKYEETGHVVFDSPIRDRDSRRSNNIFDGDGRRFDFVFVKNCINELTNALATDSHMSTFDVGRDPCEGTWFTDVIRNLNSLVSGPRREAVRGRNQLNRRDSQRLRKIPEGVAHYSLPASFDVRDRRSGQRRLRG
jgi:hypothetical protein